ncbi:MAG: universal stress protein [Proteobacteria bacterium]|nr:universal stress protein [Pseudomonadota bacterium]
MTTLNDLLAHLGLFAQPVELALINVHEKIPYGAASSWVGKDVVERYYAEESDKALAPGMAVLQTAGLGFTPVRKVGDPATEIARYADEWDADVIAIGRHGHSALQKLLMGSVAQKVVAVATIPVLLLG